MKIRFDQLLDPDGSPSEFWLQRFSPVSGVITSVEPFGRVEIRSDGSRLGELVALLRAEGSAIHICEGCWDLFDTPVIHCRHCHHHLSREFFTKRERCKYCHRGLQKSPETQDVDYENPT